MHILNDKTTASIFRAHEFDLDLKNNCNGYVDSRLIAAISQIDPPLNNMGGTPPLPPLFFPQCEILAENVVKNQRVLIDWLGFSTTQSLDAVFLSLQVLFLDLEMVSGHSVMRGYSEGKFLKIGSVQIGTIGYGAKHGRISVSLTGSACKKFITDEHFYMVYEVLKLLDARISRIDLALDFYQAEFTFDAVFNAYKNQRFKKENSPFNPVYSIVSGCDKHGNNAGRTLYVGRRDGEVMARIYEKGLEVFAKMSEEYRELSTEREDNFFKQNKFTTIADDWLRVEIEFKRKEKTRPIILEIILCRDDFYAGSFPYCADLLGSATGRGRGSLKTTKQITHDKLILAHRASYGNHVHSLRDIGFSDTEIVDLLDTGSHNQKLLKAGLIEIEKTAFNNALKINPDFDIPF